MALSPNAQLASAAVLLGAALWGLYWIPVRHLEDAGIDGATTVAILNAPAGIITAIWVAATWKSQTPHWKYALVTGTIAGAALALYGVSITQTSVIRATILFYLMPIWATMIGVVWLGETADWRRWAAIFFGMTGLFLLLWSDAASELNIGDVLAFLSGWVWAIATALMKKTGKVPIGGMLCVQFICVALAALAIGTVLGGSDWPDAENFASALTIGTLISVFGLLPALVMIFWASQFLFPGRVGLLLMAEVVVAVISASILLPEESPPGPLGRRDLDRRSRGDRVFANKAKARPIPFLNGCIALRKSARCLHRVLRFISWHQDAKLGI